MSLVVRLTTNSSFDDSLDRNAIARYCVSKNCTYVFGDRYSPIDICATKPDGTRVALELTCNACWTTQLKYPEPCIHIPRRKWKMFHEQAREIPDKNFNRAEKAYLVVLNTEYTRAAFISFSSILNDLALFKEDVMDIHDDPTIFVCIPTLYISGYVNIPPEQKEI